MATFPGGLGGPQRHVASLAQDRGFGERFECVVWEVPDCYRGVFGKLALSREVARRVRSVRPDVIYLNVDLSLACWLVLAFRLSGSTPVVVHSHNAAFDAPRNRLALTIYRYLTRELAAGHIALSPEAARAMFGSDEGVAIVHCLIDFETLHAAAAVAGPPPKRTRFIFACVGRLAPQKNQTLAVKALARLIALGFDAELLLVGDGADRAALEALARRLSIGDRVRITGELADAARIYAQEADAVLVCSRYEGQSRVVAEAQSFGLPVLASSGVPESAWIADARLDRRGLRLDPEVWAEAMVEVMTSLKPGCRMPMPMTPAELNALGHGLVGGSRQLAALLDEVAGRRSIKPRSINAQGGNAVTPDRRP